MTETPHQQSVPDERQPTEQDQQHPQAGLDRQNLRNYERLTRSVDDRKVAGVAGGLGRHLNMDPTILRVLFVVLCFFGGAGFLLYGAAWLLVPEDGRTQGTIASSPSTRNGLLIAAGVVAALLLIGDSWGGIGFPWPVLLVGIGVLLYLLVKDRGAPQPTETTAAAAPPVPPWAPTPVGATAPVPAYQPRPRPDRGPKLFGFTLAVIAIALGALGLYEAAGGDVLDAAYPALALTIVGLMLVVGAFVGRAGGLILLGLVSTVALLATSVAGTFGSTDGDRLTVTPVSASAVRSDYHLDSGRMVVDLSGVTDPQALDGRVIHLDAEAAEMRLILPRGVRSEVVADIDGPGQIELPGRSSGGIDTHLEGSYGEGTATVTFDTHLSIGHIDVRNP